MGDGLVVVWDFTGPDGQLKKPGPRVVKCPHCGGKRYAATGAHAARYPSVAGEPMRDCVGQPVVFNGSDYVRRAA